jgi:hypothetical protein
LPGIPAIEQISPVIQQAASDPGSAASLLMAAAAAFTGNSTAPADSKQVADSVSQFVQTPAGPDALPDAPVTNLPATAPPDSPAATPPRDPAVHMPTFGSVGDGAHLPTGKDPANAVGPAPQAAPGAQEYAAHLPMQGSAGGDAHLPVGKDPANAVGPAAQVAPSVPAAEAAAAPSPEVAPAAHAPTPAPEAASEATPGFAPDSPPTQDFMYPAIGQNCLADGGAVIATALSVAGPANIPAPGPTAGQTAYVFTAVGTPGPAEVQKLPLNVTWVNLTTGKSGSATLKPRGDINADGPTTLTAVADTGSGSIMSTIFGQVSTQDSQCNFIPTIGSTVVP